VDGITGLHCAKSKKTYRRRLAAVPVAMFVVVAVPTFVVGVVWTTDASLTKVVDDGVAVRTHVRYGVSTCEASPRFAAKPVEVPAMITVVQIASRIDALR
jgi:hypothetical protein